MISKKIYEELKSKYGDISSWAIWAPQLDKPKSNTGNMSVFENKDLLKILNPHYVFVGLNCSSTHGERTDGYTGPWGNFHSTYSGQNDYKLRYALTGTKYWGAYITDFIKRFPEVDSGKVAVYVSKYPELLKKNVDEFKQEISLLGTKPVLIALGSKTYDYMKRYLSGDYQIVKVTHYAHQISKENYRKDVLKILDEIG